MRLYHATALENKEDILMHGLRSADRSDYDRYLQAEGVYGFTSLKDALSFGKDQCFNGGTVVFSFDADIDGLILDLEYEDNEAYFYETEDRVIADLVHE